MKYAIGFAAGLVTAWAALAIWSHIPPFPDLDASPTPPPPPFRTRVMINH